MRDSMIGDYRARGHAPRTPDLNELRGFCVAADLGTLGRAAVRLHVSQPSLSKRLAVARGQGRARSCSSARRAASTLTPAGRRLYRHARPLLEAADQVGEVMAGIRHTGAVVRLAASHSASEAFVAAMLAGLDAASSSPVELVTANSQVVRALVADGRADLGVAASRPDHTPNPGVRETELVDDAIVCAVPPGHPWARARHGRRRKRFLATPMVVRDPSSNARWTVDAVLADARAARRRRRSRRPPTPRAAHRGGARRSAPVLLSRHVLAQTDFVVVESRASRSRAATCSSRPAYGEPTGEVRELVERIREHVRIWLR